MKVIDTRNVSTAVAQAIPYLLQSGIEETSRNGTVIVAPTPVMTVYNCPKEHVLFGETRDANPFFHLFEALWMLAGRCDLYWPMKFNKRFREYSDDGATVHGAYGHRWRRWFDFDQLKALTEELKSNPNSRRAVLTMWSPTGDLVPIQRGEELIGGLKGRDVPCNTHAYFDLRGGRLNMTVCNRSNDAIWGAYGANVVHFSLLLEYMADQLGAQLGEYRQFSNNFHAYTDIYDRAKLSTIGAEAGKANLYNIDRDMMTVPLASHRKGWMEDLNAFLDTGAPLNKAESFFTLVAEPMYDAWHARKNGSYEHALRRIDAMPNCDWSYAARGWLTRRQQKEQANAA